METGKEFVSARADPAQDTAIISAEKITQRFGKDKDWNDSKTDKKNFPKDLGRTKIRKQSHRWLVKSNLCPPLIFG
jgi:hypothetical protein